MKRWILIPTILFLIAFQPTPGRAETRVYVTFSIGGAAVVGAAVFYWSFSYTSQVSEHRPVEERPDPLSLTTASELNSQNTVQLVSQLIPQPLTAEERTRADSTPVVDGPYTASSVEVPLLVFRW